MTTQTMKAAVVTEAKAAWELQDRPVPALTPDQVLVRIHACGICGTDAWMAEGDLSFKAFPLVLGHEGVGEVVAIGTGVTSRRAGDRVGMPIVQKACGRCDFCRGQHEKSFVTASNCANPTLTGVNVDGAHAEFLAADAGGTVLLRAASPTRTPRLRSARATRSGAPSAGLTPSRMAASPSSVSAASATSRFSTRRRRAIT